MAPQYTGVLIRNTRARPGPHTHECIHVSVTSALFTTTSRANTPHTSRCTRSVGHRRPQDHAMVQMQERERSCQACRQCEVRGVREEQIHKARAAHGLRSAPRPRRIPPPWTSCRGSPTGFVHSRANSQLSGPVDKNRTTAGEHDTEHWVQAMWCVHQGARLEAC